VGYVGKLRDVPVAQNTVDLIWPHCRIGHDCGSSRLDIFCTVRYLRPPTALVPQGPTAPILPTHRCSAAIVVKSRRKDNAVSVGKKPKSDPKIALLQARLRLQRRGATGPHHTAPLDDVMAVGEGGQCMHVLVDHQDRLPGLL